MIYLLIILEDEIKKEKYKSLSLIQQRWILKNPRARTYSELTSSTCFDRNVWFNITDVLAEMADNIEELRYEKTLKDYEDERRNK